MKGYLARFFACTFLTFFIATPAMTQGQTAQITSLPIAPADAKYYCVYDNRVYSIGAYVCLGTGTEDQAFKCKWKVAKLKDKDGKEIDNPEGAEDGPRSRAYWHAGSEKFCPN